jgi:hypothetical protein
MQKVQKRKSLPEDKEKIDEGIKIIQATMRNHPEIDGNQWLGALATLVARTFHNSHLSYEQFEGEMERIKNFYKYLWDAKQ